MQCIKGSSTLRLSGKGDKPPPKIVYKFGSQDCMVKRFLEHRDFVEKLIGDANGNG